MTPDSIFLFNSALPDPQAPKSEWMRQLGAPQEDIVGLNTGNGYISYAILKILFGRPLQVAHLRNAWNAPLPASLAEKINREHSHFVFVMQDYIREDFKTLPFERINQFLEMIRIPVVPISLSANGFNGYDLGLAERLGPAQKRFLSIVADKSPAVGVRGHYTAELLNRLGIKNAVVTGCPAYFESGPNRRLKKRPWNPDRVVTTGGFYSQNTYSGAHVLQDELCFIIPLFLHENIFPTRPNLLNFSTLSNDIPFALHLFLRAMNGRLHYFPNYDAWSDFYAKNEWCLTIGSRLHSAIMSCNRGVPAIVTNCDARAMETCEYFGIACHPVGMNDDLAAMYENLDLSAVNDRYDACYADFRSYLRTHGLEPTTVTSGETFQFPNVQLRLDSTAVKTLYDGFATLLNTLNNHCLQAERQNSEFNRLVEELRHHASEYEEQIRRNEEHLAICDEFMGSKIGRFARNIRNVLGHVRHSLKF